MMFAVGSAHLAIRALPALKSLPPAAVALQYRPVSLRPASPPFRLAGAWELSAPDPRFTGLSALAIADGALLAVSDRGAVVRFEPPGAGSPTAILADLADGPGPWGMKWSRDAESLARDPAGRGWWVGFEQDHSLYLYDPGFRRAISRITLPGEHWGSNQGAEALVVAGEDLVALAENGRDVVRAGPRGTRTAILQPPAAGSEIADAARAPDGSAWILLRSKGLGGISQSLARLEEGEVRLGVGPRIALPSGPFDNLEGLAIEERGDGGWRFWLLSDDGHRLFARTLLVALDYDPSGHKKSPAQSAGPSGHRRSKKGP